MSDRKTTNSDDRLIIFTRYPEAGKTKTRMIPALGEEGAATLQRQMTEHTLSQVKTWQRDRDNRELEKDFLSIAVYFAGGSEPLMRDWLGENLAYQPQSEGDLGERMVSAFERAFAAGIKKAVIIGIDCPGITPMLLDEAFVALERYDLVLGTAADGGYYLIGLTRLIPELFKDIPWGTGGVLQKTREIARKLELSIFFLPLLHDIDRPEDLAIWQQYFQS